MGYEAPSIWTTTMNLHHGWQDTGIGTPTGVVTGGCAPIGLEHGGTTVEVPRRMSMSIYNVLYLLAGAGLVAFGVLAHAAATLMLKNHRTVKAGSDSTWEDWEWRPVSRAISSRPAAYRKADASTERPAAIRQPIPVIQKKPQKAVVPTEVDLSAAMAKEVTLVLVSSGYSKATAQAAVEQVGKRDRESLETWTVAALRNAKPNNRGIA